jgi:hypothetical protein
VRVGAGDDGVRRHPVAGVGLPLLGREKGQKRRQRIEGKGLAVGEMDVLSPDLEKGADRMVAHERLSLGVGQGLDAEVVKAKSPAAH